VFDQFSDKQFGSCRLGSRRLFDAIKSNYDAGFQGVQPAAPVIPWALEGLGRQVKLWQHY
jgi:hypothetical protein